MANIVKVDKFLGITKKTNVAKFSAISKKVTGDNQNLLLNIEKKVIKIDKLLKDSLLLQKTQNEKKRVSTEQKTFANEEKELEKKKPKESQLKGGIGLPSPPKIGIFGWIKNFIGNLFLGFIAVRLIDHLPQLIKTLPIIMKAGETIIDFAGSLLNGLVTFVDWGYKAVDATRGFIKTIGGDNTLKLFDSFGGAVNKLIDVAIIAAMVAGNMGGDSGGGGGGGGRPRTGGYRNGVRTGQYNGFNTRTSPSGTLLTKTGAALRGQRGDFSTSGYIKSEKDIMKRYFQKYGRDAFVQRFGQEGLERLPGGMARSGLTKFARNAFVGLAGKGGAKTVLKFIKPFTKRIPIIGGLIDFGLSVALGESPGRAAFKAIGATLLGAIGGAIGAVGGPAAIAGAIIGGMAGDWAGGALYDLFFGGKKPKTTKTTNAATGGPITSGRSSTKRTITKKTKRTIKIQPTKIKPGASVGGEEKIAKVFPESKDKSKINPLGYMKKSYDTLSSSPGFGGVFGLALKANLGEKPSDLDYKIAASGLSSWMESNLGASGAFAEGGSVDVGMFGNGKDMTNMIAKSLQDTVSTKIDDTINDLMKQMMLKPLEPGGAGGPGEGQPSDDLPPGSGTLTGNTNAEKVFNYLIGYGFTPQAAAGVVGNLMQESGVNPNSNQHGGGPGRGIMQWGTGAGSGQRWDALTAWATSSGKDPRSLDTQVEWMMKEMHQRGTFKRLKGLSNVKAATDLFEKEMEGAGTPIMENRYKYAADALASFGGGGAGGPGMTGMDKGGVGGSIAEYITGDPNTPFGRFDKAGHGTTGNYHDHIAFKDRNTAVRAYNFFKSKGIQVTEFKGFDSVGGHASGSYHYSGLAFDVPGAQWGGSGAIGPRDYAGSAKVRTVLKQFAGGGSDLKAMFRGGIISKPTRIFAGEKGAEFIFDNDTTRNSPPGFLDALNKANTKQGVMYLIQKYASYNQPYGGEPQVVEVPVYVPMPSGGSGGMIPIPMGGGVNSNADLFEGLAQQG